ncbi:hypothetical protein EKK58_01630 [Candidatus Dependentiae bacterium]|nr:MAG: hypothetical protein EKK58_01630 [Candidatus Dependentiae bacterium]
MYFYNKKLFLILFSCFVTCITVAGTIDKPLDYDSFVTKNQLMQHIYSLLHEAGYTSETQKEKIMRFLYSDTQQVMDSVGLGLNQADLTNLYNIKEQVQYLMKSQPTELQEKKYYASICLDALPKRGIKFTLCTILECFKLSNKKFADTKKYNPTY